MPTAMKSVVVDVHTYDWEGDTPLQRPSSRTIVYEMHVRGFTRHPSSGVAEQTRGTFAGLIAKIPYLQQLGITAVELMAIVRLNVPAVFMYGGSILPGRFKGKDVTIGDVFEGVGRTMSAS